MVSAKEPGVAGAEGEGWTAGESRRGISLRGARRHCPGFAHERDDRETEGGAFDTQEPDKDNAYVPRELQWLYVSQLT